MTRTIVTFTPAELAYLAEQRLGRLATVDAGGAPQNNPVGFRYNPDTGCIDVHGHDLAASRKFRNVAATGVVAFVVDDLASVQPWQVRGIEIRGHADALTGQPADVIRIHPETVFSWGVEPGTTGMQKRTGVTENGQTA